MFQKCYTHDAAHTNYGGQGTFGQGAQRQTPQGQQITGQKAAPMKAITNK